MSIFLRVIDTMPGAPRKEAFAVLLDWWGTFHPGPGFETYHDPADGPVEITSAIIQRVREAAPMLRRVAEEPPKQDRRAAMELLRCLDTGWIPQPLPHQRHDSKAERRPAR